MNKYLLLLFAFTLVGFGSYLMIETSVIGLAPFTSLYKKLSESLFSVGSWVIIIQVVFIIFSFLIERKLPRIGTFINMIFTGIMIDFFMWLDLVPAIHNMFFLIIIFTLGLFIQGIGVALAVCMNLGPGAITQFSVALENVYKINIKHSIIFLDITVALIVLVFNGPISLGTIMASVLGGYFTNIGLNFWRKIFKIK